MPLRLEPAWNRSIVELTDLMNQAYSEYFVPLHFTPATWTRSLRVHGIDLDTSRVVCRDDMPVGIALLAHRGWTTRLAGMGIAPAYRATGIGHWLLQQILTEGRQRGDRAFTLEVIEDNTRALRLYERAGFTSRRRLLGYHGSGLQGNASQLVEEVDVREVARQVIQVGEPDLPWQVSGETLIQAGPPARGFRLGDAFTVIEPQETQVEMLSLLTLPGSRRRGVATRLLRALFSNFPGREWKLPARFPGEVAPNLFTKLGFVQTPISQRQVVLPLV